MGRGARIANVGAKTRTSTTRVRREGWIVTERASAREVLENYSDGSDHCQTIRTYPPQQPEMIKVEYFHLPAVIDVTNDESNQMDV